MCLEPAAQMRAIAIGTFDGDLGHRLAGVAYHPMRPRQPQSRPVFLGRKPHVGDEAPVELAESDTDLCSDLTERACPSQVLLDQQHCAAEDRKSTRLNSSH